MALELYFHPFASFCWKVLIGLYENDTPFDAHVVDLSKEAERTQLQKLWPLGKFPVLRDGDRVVPESSVILEYLAAHHPGKIDLVGDGERAREIRAADRFMDVYVHYPMQKIVGDRIRPREARDAYGVDEAKRTILKAYEILERDLNARTWAAGDSFTMADCAASPALYYANRVVPIGEHANVAVYLARLEKRPSFARVLDEAKPYAHFFPA